MRNPLLVLFVACIVFIVPAASAEDIIISSVNSHNFSGLPNEDFEGSFTVLNNGTQAHNLEFRTSGLSALDVTISPNKITLRPGESQGIRFGIVSDPEDEGLFVGKIIGSGVGINSMFVDVILNLSTVNFMAFTIDEVRLGGIVLNNLTNTTGFGPGDLVELSINVHNQYSDPGDPSIDSIHFVDVLFPDFLDEGTRDFEPEFEASSITLRPGTSQELISKKFRIPFDLENNKSYKLIIDLEAEDAENRQFYANFTSFIVVTRHPSQIGFSDLHLSSEHLSCGDRLDLEIGFVNLGNTRARDASYIITLEEFNLSYVSPYYNLSVGERDRSKHFVSEVNEKIFFTIPQNTPLGFYHLIAKTYIEANVSRRESRLFEITACPQNTESPEASSAPSSQLSTATQNQSTLSVSSPSSSTTSSPPNISTEETAVTLDSIDLPLNTRSIIISIVVGIIILLVLLLGILAVVLYHGNAKHSSNKSEKSKKLSKL